MKFARAALLLFFLSLGPALAPAVAHEGHGPSQDVPPNGGILRDNKDLQLELVKVGSTVKLYAHTLDLKAVIPPKEIQVVKAEVYGTKKLERPGASAKKDSYSVTRAKFKVLPSKLVPDGDHFLLNFEADGSYRYVFFVELKVNGKAQSMVEWAMNP
jgi:hypothetical protein